MATAFQPLFDIAECYASCGQLSAVQAQKIALLATIAIKLNPNAHVEPNELMEQGKCFACVGASEAEIMELALLAIIAAAVS